MKTLSQQWYDHLETCDACLLVEAGYARVYCPIGRTLYEVITGSKIMNCPNCKEDVIIKKGDKILTRYCPECGVDVQKLLAPDNEELKKMQTRNKELEDENRTLKQQVAENAKTKTNLP